MLGYGLVRDEHSFLRDPWCVLDGIVVAVSWIDIAITCGAPSLRKTGNRMHPSVPAPSCVAWLTFALRGAQTGSGIRENV